VDEAGGGVGEENIAQGIGRESYGLRRVGRDHRLFLPKRLETRKAAGAAVSAPALRAIAAGNEEKYRGESEPEGGSIAADRNFYSTWASRGAGFSLPRFWTQPHQIP
jgi:hypothetical protein